ncbi:MAG: DinB family protein [Candidatus Halalkalibacterium sp. M3_1C_030]
MLFTLITAFAHAQNNSSEAVVNDFLNVYNTTTGKAVQLAGAFPVDSYDWRPAEGIRSVRESILHLASGNYFFGSMLGIPTPDGVDARSMEKSELAKDEAIAALKESVSYINEGLKNISAEEFETKIDFFGNEITKRQAMFILGDHAAEHLGQLIAYARSNGVTPPLSR